jgi:phosphoenolpyruvate carboxylase
MKRMIYMLFAWMACTTTNQDKKILAQAAEYHLQAVALSQKVEHKLDSLKKSASKDQNKIIVIERDLEAWKNELVGVPGFENEQEHHHAHDQEQVQATPHQMLDIQKELLNRIETIHKNLNEEK